MILNWVLVAVVVTVLIVVSLLLLGALVRKRRAADFHQLEHGGHGLRWIYIGTGISTCILFALVIYTLTTLNTIARPPTAPALTLTVTGYDWWWKVAYDDANPAQRFVTANEIHIPVGVPVLIKLQSADVIHAFWVPLLAGKTQMIPGLVNQQ
ncbi:MAG TPA: cytochrome C, partial [Methylophilaceae bacterium]|nr:cytochrome C [Methylophilaceae bacterium]